MMNLKNNNEKFCIKNEEFCIENNEFCRAKLTGLTGIFNQKSRFFC